MKPDRAWVLLGSGKRLNLIDPQRGDWRDLDLAVGLSRTYRWGGHSRWELPLSVAQHSLLVLVLRQQMQPHRPLTPGEALRELLHDADEGLLGFDPISPLKPHLGADFNALTCRLRRAIDIRYRLPEWSAEDHLLHKRADHLAAAPEALHVAGWSMEDITEKLGISLAPVTIDPLRLLDGLHPWEPWPPRRAAALFLAKLRELDSADYLEAPADLTTAIEREAVIAELGSAFFRLPLSQRRRCAHPITGSGLSDTFVFVETDDVSQQHLEGVIVDGERDADGQWLLSEQFTVFTTAQELIRVSGLECHVEYGEVDEISREAITQPSSAERQAVILSGLTRSQAEAATLQGAVLVLAGAGTGKTRTLTAGVASRIAVRGIPLSHSRGDVHHPGGQGDGDRIRTMLAGEVAPSWVGTFHGLGARQLRIEPEVAVLRPDFDILDADDSKRLVKRTMKAMNIDPGDPGNGRDPLKQLCNRIAKFKDNLITPDEAPARVEAMIAQATSTRTAIDPDGMRMAARVYLEYQRRLREANAADFGDLLLWPTKAMQRDGAYRRRWEERFDCVLADEYQDVCYVQYAWLRLLCAVHGEIFCVGDDDQSVYSFRGADISFIRRFGQDFPQARQVRLEDNFRSSGHILAAANAVISQDKKRLGKTLRTTKAIGEPIEVIGFRDPDAEAAGIIAEIKRRGAGGVSWDHMAVLYRSNHLSRGLEEALMRSRIPYLLVGDVAFYQRSEVKDALALLRLAAHPDGFQSDEAFRRVCNTPARGIGPKALEEIQDEAAFRGVSLLQAVETAKLPQKAGAAAQSFVEVIRRVSRDTTASLADQVSLLLDRTGYRAMLHESRAEETENRLENLQELVTLAGGFHNASELLDHAALSGAAPGEATEGRVRLMTLHKGKGLEFPHVFLPGWDATTFPSAYGDHDEERRLAYVALTRGMQRVSITHVENRRGFTRPSCFIDDIPIANRVTGWLHGQAQPTPRKAAVSSRAMAELDALELVRRF